MQPVGTWLKESFEYVRKNWLMLLKVYGWGMLMYIGSSLFLMIIVAIVVFVGGLFGLTLSVGTGFVVFILGLGGMIYLFAMVGKMLYIQILAVMAPVANIRQSWRTITWKEGLSLYLVILLSVFAGYGGMILLIIPGIVVFTWVSMAIFVKVEQKIGGLRALMLSRDYVRNYFWPVLGRFLLMIIISSSWGFLVAFGFVKLNELGGVFAVVGWVLYMASLFVVMSGIYRLMYTLYLNLVRIKGRLELVTTPWRNVRWGLLVFSPFVLIIVTTIVMIVINPAKQIQKAKEVQQQQQIRLDNYK